MLLMSWRIRSWIQSLCAKRMEYFPSLEILEKIRRDLEIRQINPEQFGGRIFFMPMFNESRRLVGIRKKKEILWILFRIPQGGLREQLETTCMITLDDSKDAIQKINSVKYGNQQDL